MKKTFAYLSILALAITGVLVTPSTSSAVPAFARQTGYECNACHFQYFPKLSAMGRAFKLGGLTDASVDMIEGDNMSFPATMPVSFIVKLRYLSGAYKKSHEPPHKEDRGIWEIPDEATFFLGGRLAKNIGYALEVADHGFGKGAVLFGIPTGGDFKLGVYVQATDGHGPANGMELNNTGFLRGQRGWEDRGNTYAAQNIGLGTGATGLGLYGGNEMFWFNVGLWGPASYFGGLKDDGKKMDAGFDMAMYYRAAFTPSVGGFDLSLGVIGSSGSVKCVHCGDDESVTEIKTDFTGADFQAQGEMGGMTLEITGSYVTGGGEDIAFPSSKKTNMNVGFALGVTPAFGIKANMLTVDADAEGKDMSGTGVGVWYQFAQNVYISPEYIIFGGDGASMDNKITVLLFLGF